MKVLFLDQSGMLGGAELCLADIAQQFCSTSLVGVFAEGSFPQILRQSNIPVVVLAEQILQVQKASGVLTGLSSLNRLLPLIIKVTQLSKNYDLIYANTQKALVVGAIASLLSHRPLVYHLHDIVSPDHFSTTNRRLIVTLANRAALIIANSQASSDAFIAAGGRSDTIQVVYNGFRLENYQATEPKSVHPGLNLKGKFVVGHFSRLAPWKGQHILMQALSQCPDDVVALLVGDALFGENDYVAELHRLVDTLNLQERVNFLGFRAEVPQLMHTCDLVAHTSTAPEPFGRVIVEAMLCGRPVVATAAGGVTELIQHGQNGWLFPPGDEQKLAHIINNCRANPAETARMATFAETEAQRRFNLEETNRHIHRLLAKIGH